MGYPDYNAPIVEGGNFTWGEYSLLRDWGILAVPTEQEIKNAMFLFERLQPLRKDLGKAMIIKSGARTREYTLHLRRQGIRAAMGSAHNEWKAVDLIVPNMRTVDLWQFFHQRWPGRMENLNHTPTWVHLDTRNWGLRQRFNP